MNGEPPVMESQSPLERPIQFMKGIGPRRAELLNRLLLHTLKDLLFFFPVAHKDRATITPIRETVSGADVNLFAQVIDLRCKSFQGGRGARHRVEALLADSSGQLRAIWWNPYVVEKLKPQLWGFFTGKIAVGYGGGKELANAEFEFVDPEEVHPTVNKGAVQDVSAIMPADPNFGRIVPVYSLRPKLRRPDGTEAPEIKLNQSVLRKLVWDALVLRTNEYLGDDLPSELRSKRRLLELSQAVRAMHFPESENEKNLARRRLAYEELYLLSVGVALRRKQVERSGHAPLLPVLPSIRKRIDARLPFALTAAQERAFAEIAQDLAGQRPMNRLLQGDVGCGKTAVAVATMLAAVAHGQQAALLAPTEVLAEQHIRTLESMLSGSRVRIGLLRGGSSATERVGFLAALQAGEIHIAIGTHALLQDEVRFNKLGLVVVDEQHKFGVEQRSAIRAKGRSPHVLVMTATPIPRSLSLTLYGDLDVSVIDAPPPGRMEVTTKWLNEEDRPRLYKMMLKEARSGHAIYVVLPRIESEAGFDREPHSTTKTSGSSASAETIKKTPRKLWSEIKGVNEELKRLRENLPTLRIAALHGRMKSAEKDEVLQQLREGALDVLVSTQVIEVGIDLPKATLMVIEHAEYFGLSSLHQLRGRVGRGGLKGYCLFFGAPNTEEGIERLKAFAKTRNGFEIAEVDFELRGPGQFFGTAQSGLPEFLVADLIKDRVLLQEARADAFQTIEDDPHLNAPAHAALRRRVRELFIDSQRLGLVDMG